MQIYSFTIKYTCLKGVCMIRIPYARLACVAPQHCVDVPYHVQHWKDGLATGVGGCGFYLPNLEFDI